MQKKGQNKIRESASAQASTRKKIIAYLKKKLGTQKQASDVFNVSESCVHKVWKKYREGGIKKIHQKKRGVSGGKKINGHQSALVRQMIKDKLPDQLKLPYGLWTREAVQQLILNKFEIELSRWQVGRYLKSWGYTPQKPISKAFEQKPAKVKEWLGNEYPAIKKRAKKEKAVIYFGDETGMRSDHQAGRSYAPSGETPVIKKTGNRFSINMISAISNQGHLQFMIIEGNGRFNSDVFEMFLKQMIKYSRQKIYFVTDNHSAHKTKKINEWLAENKQKIEVFFLPPYSPELNPQEYVNQDVKTNVIGKKRPINKAEMKNNVNDFMLKRKKDKMQVKKYFHEKHVRYAA